MTPTWYDVLDLDSTATAEEIRDAWRASIADLSPGDRRFRLRNEAAETLLDEERRREYDAWLDSDGAVAATEPEPQAGYAAGAGAGAEADLPLDPEVDSGSEEDELEPSVPSEVVKDEATQAGTTRWVRLATSDEPGAKELPTNADNDGQIAESPGRNGNVLGLALTTVVALALVAFTIVVLVVASRVADEERAADRALAAAEQAIVPVLSYDYRQLEQSKAAAENFLTPEFSKEYDKLFAQLEINAPETQTVVTSEVIASGIVRSTTDTVDVYLFVNRQRTNSEGTDTFRDQVTVKMELVDDTWLINELVTATESPA